MNTELIKKYKTEFDHFLNGGKLLCALKNELEWIIVNDLTWEFKETDNIFIIINDEYSHLRKALCEGKTLEFKDPFKYKISIWEKLNTTDPSYSFYYKNEYRIKLQEPQFKVGNFVRNTDVNLVRQYTLSDLTYDMKTNHKNNWIKWEPRAGELCWFTNDKEIENARLGYFSNMNGSYFEEMKTTDWKYCEPFLNSKPSWFN